MRKFLCALVLFGCSSPAKRPVEPPVVHVEPAPTPSPPAPPAMAERVMTADTPSTDTDGNTFIAPAGWRVGTRDTLTVLTAPDSDSRIPADPAEAKQLAAHYHSDALGDITVSHAPDGKTIFDFGEFKTEVASVKNPDGTITFAPITPGAAAEPLVAGLAGGRPTLTMRDGQHEYVFTAVK